jgi:predicted O-methyltransferase YrrM
MFSRWKLALKYLNYCLVASNGKGHGMHSPFIFHFITKVLNDAQLYPEYSKVEAIRQNMKDDPTLLVINDMGAGSITGSSTQRTISSITRNTAKPKKFGQLLFRMAREYQPKTILELGTSIGITTSYLALAKPDATVISLEGADTIAEIARQKFHELKISNIGLVNGNFDSTLPTVLDGLPGVDFCFIDGNHRREPTERYFQLLLTKINSDSILVFDDIHWSPEMEQAWASIQNHPRVRCTVDLFFLGVVFFRQEFREKQHFTIRF